MAESKKYQIRKNHGTKDKDASDKKDIAKSRSVRGCYVRTAGKCRRHDCKNPAARHQVYCSRACSPYGLLQGDGVLSDEKQIYTSRKKKTKP